LDPSAPLQSLPGIGPARSRGLAEAGFRTVGDLLAHLPHRYEDRTTVSTVAEALDRFAGRASADESPAVTLRGRLEGVRRVRVRRRGFSLVCGRVADDSGSIAVLWFNRPYLPSTIDASKEYLLHGRLRAPKGQAVGPPELLNPSCEEVEQALAAGRVVPVYPSLGPLGPATVGRLLARALAGLDLQALAEPLPAGLLERRGLPRLGPALRSLHLPDEGDQPAPVDALNARRSPAHRRLIYGELLEQQLALSALRRERAGRLKAHRYGEGERLDRARRVAREILPFRLTEDQRRVLAEIAEDLRRPAPMARLLQGDVGSGKTIVAVLALVLAVESGLQGALLAPTELLAEQHFRRLEGLLGGRYRLALVTGSNPELGTVRDALAAGEVDLAVGTHALFQEDVRFRRLALAVIDEQHRFGVVQRRLMEGKGVRPDVLVMTATPIPRTLALTAFGDLDLSVIAELPAGRRPVMTEVRDVTERRTVYEDLAARLAAGERGYVVFPRIGAGDDPAAPEGGQAPGDGDVPSIEGRGRALARWLADRLGADAWRDRIAAVHGGLPAGERERVMAAFAAGRVRLLLATTVIEVGVDVPDATVMVIEGAERFGLSQLHQLRGRVGRGAAASRCFAVAAVEGLTQEGRQRLAAFAATTDGFEIAERDLEIRGFGDLLGTQQAGLARFRVADPVAHRELLESAREDAVELAGRLDEPGLEVLRSRVERALERRRRSMVGV